MTGVSTARTPGGQGGFPLAARSLTVGYDERGVLEGLDLEIPAGELTVVVGPNACGKSTLLRALSRLLRPASGSVLLSGEDIHSLATKEVARRLGLLPQTAVAPDGITVEELVARGRSPHQTILARWSHADEAAVEQAMAATDTVHVRRRYVDELSGGQRQRVWIAMALAQETELLLLDEPTTFLDVAHQVEVLELVDRLRAQGRTVVVVLHELNMAARYATHLVAMKDGRVLAQGAPADVLTETMVEEVFDLACRVLPDPDTGTPVVLPGRRRQT
ncbi:MAG: ABC transporter ATP-binding protein [Actinomycetaceae bacterium]